MKKNCFLLLIAILVQLIIISCSSDEPSDNGGNAQIELSRAEEEQLQMSNDLAFNLLSFSNATEVTQGEINKNIVIASYSFATTLSMAANCIKGDNLEQVKKALNFNDVNEWNLINKKVLNFLPNSDPKVTLSIANSMWSRPGSMFCTEQLKSTINNFYSAPCFEADLGTNDGINALNSWCSKATNNLIPNFLKDPVPVEIMMINTNYFHGEWTKKFDKSKTKSSPFTNANGVKLFIDAMKNDVNAKLSFSDNLKMLTLPYGNEKFSMNIILPNEDIDVNEVIDSFDSAKWNELLQTGMQREVSVSLPKFKIEYKADYLKYIQNITIDNPTGKSGALKISFAQQATSIETDEEGSTVAVVSGVGVIFTSNVPVEFNVNRPFIFLIHEQSTGLILFAGVVKNP